MSLTESDAAVVGDAAAGNVHALDYAPIALAYHNADLPPTRPADRKWGMKDIAALWISMAACVPTYMLASGLIAGGMNWWQAVLTVFMGNVIVLIPMVLNAHAGTKYGIPFPVYCRASFGILGANIPALLRALVACGWFGIQAWIGGWAIFTILAEFFPAWKTLPDTPLGINVAELGCFLFFWSINIFVIYKGIESIRLLLNIKAPLLIILGLCLLAWAYYRAGGFGSMLNQPSQFSDGQPKAGQFWAFFVPALTANVGFWATLSLNIPDFTRYARTQRDQVIGQAVGLPTTMALFSFISVAVTSAAFVIYGPDKSLWDPIVLLSRFENKLVLIVAMLALCLATLATNIAANVVSPANDFAHVWPKKINFQRGGYITGVIGIAMLPWKLVEDPTDYFEKWLVAYSSLLGAVGGVLIADYYVLRRTKLDLRGMYEKYGPYWFTAGFNPLAVVALALGIAPCAPGFIGTVTTIKVPQSWLDVYHYAWFLSFGVAFAAYLALSKTLGRQPDHHEPTTIA